MVDGPALCERLLSDATVALLPGEVFERPTTELTARLSYVNFDGQAALAASESVPLHDELPASFFERYCAQTLQGVERIVEWLGHG